MEQSIGRRAEETGTDSGEETLGQTIEAGVVRTRYAIYALHDPKGDPFYIGQTRNIRTRRSFHRRKYGRSTEFRIIRRVWGSYHAQLAERLETWQILLGGGIVRGSAYADFALSPVEFAAVLADANGRSVTGENMTNERIACAQLNRAVHQRRMALLIDPFFRVEHPIFLSYSYMDRLIRFGIQNWRATTFFPFSWRDMRDYGPALTFCETPAGFVITPTGVPIYRNILDYRVNIFAADRLLRIARSSAEGIVDLRRIYAAIKCRTSIADGI